MEHFDLCRVYSREVQRHCRQAVTRQTSFRMASASASCYQNIQSVWYSSDRPLCQQGNEGSRQLCDERQLRSVGPILQCFQPAVAVSTGVDIPSTESHSAHPSSPELGRGSVFIGSSNVAESLLVTRPTSSGLRVSTSRSDHRSAASSSPGNGTLCLENWGWDDVTSDWFHAEKFLLRSS